MVMGFSIRKVMFAIIASVVLIFQPAWADDNAKRNDILQLMKMTGALKIADKMAVATYQQIANAMKKANKNIPKDALEIAEKEAKTFFRRNMEGALTATIPVYEQYFSHGEIKDIIAFYKTKTGQKTILVMPQMLQQSMLISQQYFTKLMPDFQQGLVKKLQAAGYK